MKFNTLFLAAAITLALAACNKPADKPADAAPAADTATAPAADAAAAPAADASAPAATPAATDPAAAAAPAADSVGVAECDDYLNKIAACLADKVPEAQRAAFQTGIDSSRNAWKQAAATPEGKAGLAQACKMALDQSKAQYAAFGCTL
ncbi:hypothetical protein ABU614_13955 [Lysobacter firmicutimachus]|uniref:Glutaconyl-CoA decarboxylase subunit gamma n=1 Tax=Lysobacter firmicutimachus TaxID=1792846 RepID=A0AAU8MQJ7_9GAMM|nr:hypothetical protein [Lysobacter antibioticus]